MSDAKFYAVFFDVAKPAIRKNAIVKKIDQQQFTNLLDEAIPNKTVELLFSNGIVETYLIESRQTFWTDEYDMINGQQSGCFIICNVKKI